MAFVKMGFHCGLGGNHNGIGAYMRQLDAAGVPFAIKSINNVGLVVEAAQYTNANHAIILRFTNPGNGGETPNYKLPPADSALDWYNKTKQSLANAPEFEAIKGRVWLEIMNEPRTVIDDNDPMFDNMHPVDWLGWFAFALSTHLIADGYKMIAFGMNSGTSEPEDWERSGMLAFLSVCADLPKFLAIGLHEYNTGITVNPDTLYPHILGRFTHLFKACDDLGFNRPTTFITESGWAYNDMPDEQMAMEHIAWYAELLAKYPNIKGAFTWTLEGTSQLPNKLQRLIEPVTRYAIDTRFPDPELPPPITECQGEPRVQYRREYRVWPSDATEEERIAIATEAAIDNSTSGPSYDDSAIGALDDKTAVLYNLDESQHETFLEWYERHYPGTKIKFKTLSVGTLPEDTLDGLVLGPLFKVPFDLSSPFGAERDYANKLHEGADYDILTHETDSKEPVLACYDGIVIKSGNIGGAYGERIIIESQYGNTVFRLWYAHLDTRYAAVGDSVSQGQPIAELGGTGGDWSEHVHLNLQHDDTGLDGFVIPKVRDPHPFMTMTPTPMGDAQMGLHASADPNMPESDFYEFKDLQPGIIKVLSFHDPNDIAVLVGNHPNAKWVVRAFLRFWNDQEGYPRDILPSQFFDWTFPDVQRTLNILQGKDVVIELHNEPNLNIEGLGGSWFDGETFVSWWLAVLAQYRQAIPGYKFLYPGLSPGHDLFGTVQRINHVQFFEESRRAVEAADGLAIHAYWGNQNQMLNEAVPLVDDYIARVHGMSVWVTESSNNQKATPDERASQYHEFWQLMKQRPPIQGVTYFVCSASEPSFESEVWAGNGIGAKVRSLMQQ